MNISFLPVIASFVVGLYSITLFVLMLYGLHRYWIVFLYWKYHKKIGSPAVQFNPAFAPTVVVQLPIYNELYVIERLIDCVCAMDYPKELLHIQVLDDSNDETVQVVRTKVEKLKDQGYRIDHIRRSNREGFKAGALNFGLQRTDADLVAIFDADFMPPAGFLKATVPYFIDGKIGMVQTRWGHINPNYSLLTRLQALFLDGHFLLEHTARHKSGAFFNFNGTAGIWRKEAIESAGGWSSRTLTEDLDLSYRAQLAGWNFVYVPEFVCPAELPVDIHAFRSQQRRWTKGAIQVARYILRDLWAADIPFHTKLEATVHLTANVGYFLTVLVALLLLPSLLLRGYLPGLAPHWVEISAFVLTSMSAGFFYAVSQRELYSDWKWRMRDIFALMSFGIGMCVSNAAAVWEGLGGETSEFIRTPKYNIQSKADSWAKKRYVSRRGYPWISQGVFALYSLTTFAVAAMQSNWLALPFILLFVFGFAYIASLSYLHRPAQ